jgi:hypothetical protein
MGGGAPQSAASRWKAAANPWLGAIARCSRTGSSNPSPSRRESANFQFLDGAGYKRLWYPRQPACLGHGCRAGRQPVMILVSVRDRSVMQ